MHLGHPPVIAGQKADQHSPPRQPFVAKRQCIVEQEIARHRSSGSARLRNAELQPNRLQEQGQNHHVHQRSHRTYKRKRDETNRHNVTDRLVCQQHQVIPHSRCIELAFARKTLAEAIGQFHEAQRLRGRRKNVEQNLEADVRESVRESHE